MNDSTPPATAGAVLATGGGAPAPAAVDEPDRPTGPLSHRQIVTILIGLMMGMFLAALDQTIVASAMRTIADDLQGLKLPVLAELPRVQRVPIARGARSSEGFDSSLRLLLGNLSVVGVGWGAFWQHQPDYLRSQWEALVPLLEQGLLDPPIGSRHPLDDVVPALTEIDERRAHGKVTLTIRSA